MVDAAAFFNNAFSQASAGSSTYASGIRNAMVFSSTLRQQVRKQGGSSASITPRIRTRQAIERVATTAATGPRRVGVITLNTPLQAQETEFFTFSDTDQERGENVGIEATLALGAVGINPAAENTFVVTGADIVPAVAPTTARAKFFDENGVWPLERIALAVNPRTVVFSQGKRISEKKTRTGSVFFHFTNTKNQNNDILRLTFSGNTGNMDRRGAQRNPSDPGAQAAMRKFTIWHNLYLLTREPMLLSDGSENKFTISYISPVFTQTIVFTGFFSDVLKLSESADKPHSRDYEFEFVVESTNPPLDAILNSSIFLAFPRTGADVVNQDAVILGQNVGLISP